MKSLLRCAPLALILVSLLFPSCDLTTVSPGAEASHPANRVIINEVFTLPTSKPNPYSWVEIYNATDKPVNLLSLRLLADVVLNDSVTTRIPLQLVGLSLTGDVLDTLDAGHFLLLVTDSIHFNNHTNLGPGKGSTLYYSRGTFIFVPGVGFSSRLVLAETNSLVLMDTSGTVFDVVRFGNYVSPVSPDPYAGNQSAGMIPEWSSLSRYAGAYFTGNSANDFYMESKPIPMWYSQLIHP